MPFGRGSSGIKSLLSCGCTTDVGGMLYKGVVSRGGLVLGLIQASCGRDQDRSARESEARPSPPKGPGTPRYSVFLPTSQEFAHILNHSGGPAMFDSRLKIPIRHIELVEDAERRAGGSWYLAGVELSTTSR